MATYQPGIIIDEAIGSTGGVTFRRSPHPRTMYAKQAAPLTETARRAAHRIIVSRLRTAWSPLSTEQKQSWNELATRVPVNSLTDGQKQIRGFTLFLKFNYFPIAYGDSITGDAPAAYLTESVPRFEAGVSNFLGVIVATYPGGPVDYRYQQITFRLGWRGLRRSALSPPRVTALIYADTTLQNITTQYTDVWGSIRPGQYWEAFATIQRTGFFPSSSANDSGIAT